MSGVIRRRPRVKDAPSNGQVAPFVRGEDHLVFRLSTSLYGTPIEELGGYKLTNLGSMHARVWVKGGSAIIGIRGTNVNAAGGLSDILDDAALAGVLSAEVCALSVVRHARIITEDLIKRGFCELIVAGHSLGGAAAFCIAKEFPEITRAVSFNGAAPPSGGPHTGALGRSRAYHIVGDIVSTHSDSHTVEVIRVKLLDTQLTDWGDPIYYHAVDRFYDHHRQWEYWSAQKEQEDIQDYVYHSTIGSTILNLFTGVVSKYVHVDKLREFICEHPIPGSKSDGPCAKDYSLGRFGKVLGIFAGGLLGLVLGGTSLIAVGVTGAATGAALGYQLATGEGLLDIIGTDIFENIGKVGLGVISRVQKRIASG